jgi:hypothetical protein
LAVLNIALAFIFLIYQDFDDLAAVRAANILLS